MKKLLLLGVLLGTVAQVQALTVTVLNRGAEAIGVNMICQTIFCSDDSEMVEPGERRSFGLGGCACSAVLNYPGGSSATIHMLNEGRKRIVVYQDDRGGYHWGWE